ncbi:30S ribosomal protein S17 [Candidatus Woesearchaeota archaeon]|nr:30S ribosomal protein S17 [Candidatus Woesearchaeota archaeon]
METKNIGINTAVPQNKCEDRNCPFHGTLKCRGRIFTATVLSTKMQKTATVGWERRHFLKKYERYEKRKSTVKAHNPLCINANEGDIVSISECRPLSKTKTFVIIGVLGKEKGFKEKMEAEAAAKFKRAEKEEKKDDAEQQIE